MAKKNLFDDKAIKEEKKIQMIINHALEEVGGKGKIQFVERKSGDVTIHCFDGSVYSLMVVPLEGPKKKKEDPNDDKVLVEGEEEWEEPIADNLEFGMDEEEA